MSGYWRKDSGRDWWESVENWANVSLTLPSPAGSPHSWGGTAGIPASWFLYIQGSLVFQGRLGESWSEKSGWRVRVELTGAAGEQKGACLSFLNFPLVPPSSRAAFSRELAVSWEIWLQRSSFLEAELVMWVWVWEMMSITAAVHPLGPSVQCILELPQSSCFCLTSYSYPSSLERTFSSVPLTRRQNPKGHYPLLNNVKLCVSGQQITCWITLQSQLNIFSRSRELKTYGHTKTCSWMFMAMVFKIVKSTNYPNIHPQVNE